MRLVYAFALLPALALATGKPQPPAKPAPVSHATATAQQHQTATSAADQQQTATGGAASATQTQSAASNQSQTASNAGNQQVSSYDYERQTAQAYAPAIAPTTVCATVRSGGISTAVLGVAGGTSGIDPQCEIRETARIFGELGYRETAALIACSTIAAARAFNGRKCPLDPEPVKPVQVEIAVSDVRTERAEARGFVPAGK